MFILPIEFYKCVASGSYCILHIPPQTTRYILPTLEKYCMTQQGSCSHHWQMTEVLTSSLFPLHLTSVQFSRSVVSNSLRPHGLQHARPPCPLPTPGVYSNSCPLSWWCHPTISSSVVPFSSHLQSLPASGSFQISQFFISGGQSIGVSASASVLPMNTQDWFLLGWTGWISLQS